MQRELKFRKFYRWDKDFKSATIDAKKGDIHIEYATLGRCSLPLSRTPISDWLQYTGLTDKNGVEIYEGDIIKLFNGDLYTVKFIEENNETEMSGYFFSSFGSEVIGNIFENNELLKA